MLEKASEKISEKSDRKEPVVVKKYANRRLYNTETSTYVTLDDLASMVKAARDFVVYDAKTGDDLTHSVLTQIIVEQEGRMGGQTLLPIPFLRQLIRFYGDSVEKMVPSYLQASLDILTKEQERFRKQFNAFTPQGAFEAYQDQARKNLAIFENAMQTMFKPFGPTTGAPNPTMPVPTKAAEPVSQTKAAKPAEKAAAEVPAAASDELAQMRAQLAAMQSMIDKLAREKP
ncbi:MAG TPA: polyhydroxyalkanoate synthesis repressor PhaR [Hyphomicrobiaceae bacterium]|nr:polyhydroxyalkanoate synthesis repressor PhaR [Hyphomicrobiaceae bacterium]